MDKERRGDTGGENDAISCSVAFAAKEGEEQAMVEAEKVTDQTLWIRSVSGLHWGLKGLE